MRRPGQLSIHPSPQKQVSALLSVRCTGEQEAYAYLTAPAGRIGGRLLSRVSPVRGTAAVASLKFSWPP